MQTLESFCAKSKLRPALQVPFTSSTGLYRMATDSFILASEWNSENIQTPPPIETTYFEKIKDCQQYQYDFTCKKVELRRILKNCKENLILTKDSTTQGISTDTHALPYEIFKAVKKSLINKALSFCPGKDIYIKFPNGFGTLAPILIYGDNKDMAFCLVMPARL